MASVESFMQLLESLDSLQLSSDDLTSRSKRKNMVDRIQVSGIVTFFGVV